MAVAFLLEIPGFTPEQSAAVLQELGLDKNTVVVYTSDHGEMAG
jgi:3-mercaptopyruvate sulfurtransferase SseA